MDKAYDAVYKTKRCVNEDALLAHLLGEIRSGRTLDLACGTGHFHAVLLGKIVGLDKDPEMLLGCKSGADLYLGNFTALAPEIKASRFQLVTNIFGVYGNYEEFKKMLGEAMSVLLPGGGVFLVAFGVGRRDGGFAKEILDRWGFYVPFTLDLMKIALRRFDLDIEYCFGMSATLLDWLSFLPAPVYRSVFYLYHWLHLPDAFRIKNLRAHYVVVFARKQ